MNQEASQAEILPIPRMNNKGPPTPAPGPPKSDTKSPTSVVDDQHGMGVVSPFSDFLTSQSEEIKRQKHMEREARESLNKPAKGNYQAQVVAHNDAGILSFGDFAAQQSALRKAEKGKEREARLSLNKLSAQQTSVQVSNDAGLMSREDFLSHQRTLEMERREKEREARVSLSRPGTVAQDLADMHLTDAASRHAAELKALNDLQKQKAHEARKLMSSYRTSTAEGASDRVAASLKRYSMEQKLKLKEARELANRTCGLSNAPHVGGAAENVASDLKRLSMEQKQKQKEAQQLACSYRLVEHEARTPAEKAAREEKRRHKQRAEEKSQYAAQVKTREIHTKERNDHLDSSVTDVETCELFEERRKKLQQIQTKTASELAMLKGSSRLSSSRALFEQHRSTDKANPFKTRAAAELASLQSSGQEGNENDIIKVLTAKTSKSKNEEDLKARTTRELSLLQGKSSSMLIAFEESAKQDATLELKARTAIELSLLQGKRDSMLIAFEKSAERDATADWKARADSELSQLQGKSSSLKHVFE